MLITTKSDPHRCNFFKKVVLTGVLFIHVGLVPAYMYVGWDAAAGVCIIMIIITMTVHVYILLMKISL